MRSKARRGGRRRSRASAARRRRRPDEGAVEDDLPFSFRRLDDLLPLRGALGKAGREDEDGERFHHEPTSCVFTMRDSIKRKAKTNRSRMSAMTLTSSAFPSLQSRITTTDNTSLPGP